MKNIIINILLFFGYIPRHKIGTHIYFTSIDRKEYQNLEGIVIKQDKYGYTKVQLIKGTRKYRKGSKMFIASHLIKQVKRK